MQIIVFISILKALKCMFILFLRPWEILHGQNDVGFRMDTVPYVISTMGIFPQYLK